VEEEESVKGGGCSVTDRGASGGEGEGRGKDSKGGGRTHLLTVERISAAVQALMLISWGVVGAMLMVMVVAGLTSDGLKW
jgi:hypothetical protein